jgi:hypothetical protein
MTPKGTTGRCPKCGSDIKGYFIHPRCNSGKHDPWHDSASLSAPTSEPVQELVEALRKALLEVRCGYAIADVLPDSTAEFLVEAERVLARYQKREGA